MLKLLNVPISPFGTKVKMALLEKGIPFETREPDLEAAQAGRDAELTPNASPLVEIPVLIDGDVTVFDSTIIMEYLEDRWPDPPMLPVDAAGRARVRMLEDVCDTSYEAVVWGIYEVLMMNRVTGALQARLLARGREQIAGLNAWLERHLDAHPWFNGAHFGWGDCAVYPHVNNADQLGCSPPPGGKLETWLTRMRDRPSARRLAEEFTQWTQTPLNRPLDSNGPWKRLYKSHRLEWMLRSGGLDVIVDGVRNHTIRFSREVE